MHISTPPTPLDDGGPDVSQRFTLRNALGTGHQSAVLLCGVPATPDRLRTWRTLRGELWSLGAFVVRGALVTVTRPHGHVGLAEPPHKEDTVAQWLTPKRKRKCRTGLGTKPTPDQVEEERSRALLETTQLPSNPFATLQESPDSDPERRDHSDSRALTRGHHPLRDQLMTFENTCSCFSSKFAGVSEAGSARHLVSAEARKAARGRGCLAGDPEGCREASLARTARGNAALRGGGASGPEQPPGTESRPAPLPLQRGRGHHHPGAKNRQCPDLRGVKEEIDAV
ncbi:hypothetical protein NDU88_002709 [Pleurodeles waltl]|uniref:Uncharacterized protein n=1 Tax=Pleurodeles waltl TaxID=8319 RepID=A0AAV7RCP7_PLEWA|nr:hypothetical protein NDU88_002709 [Pleurodeles waltl]